MKFESLLFIMSDKHSKLRLLAGAEPRAGL
jgi:hypothetical protein